MRIYTRTGDKGQTGLVGGERISKASLRIEAIGQVDEINSAVGLARVHSTDHPLDPLLARIQNILFDLGSELASPNGAYATIQEAHVGLLERSMDEQTTTLPPLRNFILPGGTPLAAHLHHCRTVCRRAERVLYALDASEPSRPETLRFLNRLSDWFFTAARTANASENVPDVPWTRTKDL